MKKYTWSEMTAFMRQFNEENGVTCKGVGPTIKAIVVFTEDSFKDYYTETQRSYEFSNQNKAFIAGQCSNSIFADCIDGSDNGVRLDYYIGDWKVDYCYLKFTNGVKSAR